MPDSNDKFPEARRLYQDIGKQTGVIRERQKDKFIRGNARTDPDEWAKATGDLLRDKIYKKYKYDDRSLNYVPEPSNPKNYDR